MIGGAEGWPGGGRGQGLRPTSFRRRQKFADPASHPVTNDVAWTPEAQKYSHPHFDITFDKISTFESRYQFKVDFTLFFH
jgi:hypothetical protein